jgi:site-specific recombinase XerD
MNKLTKTPSAELVEIIDEAQEHADNARAKGTVKAYRADWQDFEAWCVKHGLDVLPAKASTVALYITSLAKTRKPSTIQRRLAAISTAHKVASHETPTTAATVKDVWRGIRRKLGTAKEGKSALMTADIRRMVEALPDNLLGTRDRALILVGFAGGLRRSEIVGLDHRDIEVAPEGVIVTLRRSKTDQEGRGQRLGIPYGSRPSTCPVRALKAWLEASGISEDSLFRSITRHGRMGERLTDKGVSRIVKRSTEQIGLDPTKYSAHSLRAGFATQAAASGASERAIMRQTRHTSVTVARTYIENGTIFNDNAAALLGL